MGSSRGVVFEARKHVFGIYGHRMHKIPLKRMSLVVSKRNLRFLTITKERKVEMVGFSLNSVVEIELLDAGEAYLRARYT